MTGPHADVDAASRVVDSYATAKSPRKTNILSPSLYPQNMATAAQAVFRVLQSQKSEAVPAPSPKLRASDSSSDNLKILLQPRLCTLRSYGPDRTGVIKTGRDGDDVSPFFATLSEYIESSKKSQDFEIICGRLAMIVFAATVTMEMVTGNSLFRKMDIEGIAEAGGVGVGAVACAALFAWLSSARKNVGGIFTVGCNAFIDSLIDQIIDGLFYENESNDWSDEI